MSDTIKAEMRMTRERLALYSLGLIAAVAAGVLGRSLAWTAMAPKSQALAPYGSKGGALMICGGGTLPDEIRERFIELAGGAKNAKIVVIPTAHATADAPNAHDVYLKPWRDRGVETISMLHTRSRTTADDPAFVELLKNATAVWISGGKQANLATAYGGTEVERQLKLLLDRGGIIGGTSAGAAIMTRVMIQSGRTEPTEGQGFDLLADAVVDQHFLKRKRVDRLVKLLGKHPGLLGFGIDEGTAMLVRSNHLTVLGESYVVACLPGVGPETPKLEFLRKGDEADLASLRGPEPRIVPAFNWDETTSDK